MPARTPDAIVILVLCLLLGSCAAGTPAPPATPAATLIPLATTLPTEAPLPTLPTFPADLTVMPTAGYAFRIPAGWQMQQAGGIATLEPPANSPQSGTVTLVLNGGNPTNLVIEEVSTSKIASLEDLSTALLTSLEQETLGMEIEAREELVLDGQPAHLIRARSAGFGDLEQAVQIRLIATLPARDRAFVLLGIASPPDAWDADAVLQDLIQSLRLFAPTAR
ncbi:MAG: hypothetical protein HC911_16990 [Chloroflexaceae bacterium]|nr:hypothetical protein [Chloroflexaceae bacterium]